MIASLCLVLSEKNLRHRGYVKMADEESDADRGEGNAF